MAAPFDAALIVVTRLAVHATHSVRRSGDPSFSGVAATMLYPYHDFARAMVTGIAAHKPQAPTIVRTTPAGVWRWYAPEDCGAWPISNLRSSRCTAAIGPVPAGWCLAWVAQASNMQASSLPSVTHLQRFTAYALTIGSHSCNDGGATCFIIHAGAAAASRKRLCPGATVAAMPRRSNASRLSSS